MKHSIDSQMKYAAVTLACLLLIASTLLGSAYTVLADFKGAPNVFYGTVAINGSSDPPGFTVTADAGVLTIVTSSLPSGAVGTRYSQTLVATGGSGSYTFEISSGSLPDGLSLSSAGAISGTPTTASTCSFIVQVTDEGGNTASKTYSLSIYSASSTSSTSSIVTISTSSLASGVVGTYYSKKLTATGGSGSYTFEISNGSLPDGLSLSTSGVISGTPTHESTYSFTVRVTDDQSYAGTKTFSIPIGITSSSSYIITMSPSSLANGTVGTYYSRTLSATGGSGSYTFTVSNGSLPDGLSLSTSGVILGTPTFASTFSATILVTDSNSLGVSRIYSITIASPTSASSNSTPSTSGASSTPGLTTAAGAQDISYSDLSVDPQVTTPDNAVVVALRVVNSGSYTVSKDIALNINGVDETRKTVELVPGKSQVITFNVTRKDAGTYTVKVGDLSSSFQVKDSGNSSSKDSSGFPWLIIAGAILGVIVVAVIIRILVMKSRGDL